MNIRDRQRDAYIFAEKQKGRTYRDIGRELNISEERVRQVYARVCRDKRKAYFLTHPKEYEQWSKKPDIHFIPPEE